MSIVEKCMITLKEQDFRELQENRKGTFILTRFHIPQGMRPGEHIYVAPEGCAGPGDDGQITDIIYDTCHCKISISLFGPYDSYD